MSLVSKIIISMVNLLLAHLGSIVVCTTWHGSTMIHLSFCLKKNLFLLVNNTVLCCYHVPLVLSTADGTQFDVLSFNHTICFMKSYAAHDIHVQKLVWFDNSFRKMDWQYDIISLNVDRRRLPSKTLVIANIIASGLDKW